MKKDKNIHIYGIIDGIGTARDAFRLKCNLYSIGILNIK